jgi:primosomal replication protein N
MKERKKERRKEKRLPLIIIGKKQTKSDMKLTSGRIAVSGNITVHIKNACTKVHNKRGPSVR